VAKFPTIRVTGGPLATASKVEIDGVEQNGVTRVLIDSKVGDANRITIDRFAVLEVEVQGLIEDRWTVKLDLSKTNWHPGIPATGTGKTLALAVADLFERLAQAEQLARASS
jgi:hypothetical protein